MVNTNLKRNIKAVMPFISVSVKTSIVYRVPVILSVVSTILGTFIQMALWRFIYNKDPQAISYMMAYVVISSMLSIIYANDITDRMGFLLRDGEFVNDMLKPINPMLMYWGQAFGKMITGLLIRGLPLILIFYKSVLLIDFKVENIICFFLVIILNLAFVSAIYLLLGHFGLYFFHAWPFRTFYDETVRWVSGAMIPLTIMPLWLKSVALATPFHLLYWLPIQILMNQASAADIQKGLLQISLWTVVMYLALFSIHGFILRKSIVQGT